MSPEVSERRVHFENSWLAWAALRHFLDAALLRELTQTIVHVMSAGTLTVEMLFDESLTPGPAPLATWVVRPLPLSQQSQIAGYLQRRIRAFLWQNDAEVFAPEGHDNSLGLGPASLEAALQLGTADFRWPDSALKRLPLSTQPAFSDFFGAFSAARGSIDSPNTNTFVGSLRPILERIEMPLGAAVAKHIGDLCVDFDAWDKAMALYQYAADQLRAFGKTDWQEWTAELTHITGQSIASASWVLNGGQDASARLNNALSTSTTAGTPLVLLNSSHDAWVASARAAKGLALPADLRSGFLAPPLLEQSHDLSSALQLSIEGNYRDANRNYWAVLRRQIALGLTSDSRASKALYARSLLDDLARSSSHQVDRRAFRMAICLLLESGADKLASKVDWTGRLVDVYVDDACVELVLAWTSKYPGSAIERQRVAIELFSPWVESMAIERVGLATNILGYVSVLAGDGPTSAYVPENLGGRSLEVLRDLARKRPEFRGGVAAAVFEVIRKRIPRNDFWTARACALEIAELYADVLTDDQLQDVSRTILTALELISPAAGVWPIVRPALTFLVSAPVKALSARNAELGRDIVSTVLRFGVEQETEHARALFYLYNFDPRLLEEPRVAAMLHDVVQEVRKRSQAINASNASENITALLLAPTISGPSGVEDALRGLLKILQSMIGQHPSIAFPEAFQSVLLLASDQRKIAGALRMSLGQLREWLEPVLNALLELWRHAKEHPMIFATFSIPPPTEPDNILVHNWAFASMAFAESLERHKEILEVLEMAGTQSLLANGIVVARASRLAGGEQHGIDGIRGEDRDTFYSALGRRLAAMEGMHQDLAPELCKVLVFQCLRHGPRPIDAAVLMAAMRLKLVSYILDLDLRNYAKRTENNRELRLTLLPIIEVIENSKFRE